MNRDSKLSRWSLTALVFAVSILISLALAEVVVRQLGIAPKIFSVQRGRFRLSPNPLIGYELVPFFQAPYVDGMLDFERQSNSLGYRDREHPIRKPPGSHRTLVLGDSITQGLKIADDREIYTSVLSRELGRAGERRSEVMNFGTSGYNTQQEVESLRDKGLAYEPDLVILAYCVNDTRVDSGGIFYALKHLQWDRELHRTPGVWRRSALFRLVYARYASRSESRPDPFRRVRRNTVERSLASLAELSREHDFEVLLVYFPWLDGRDPREKELSPAELAAASEKSGFRFLDLSAAMKACASEQAIAADAIHPNADGHRCAGEAIAHYMLDAGLTASQP
jgi:lysophospholipase L1-like esterase